MTPSMLMPAFLVGAVVLGWYTLRAAARTIERQWAEAGLP